MSAKILLKDQLFNRLKIERIASEISLIYPQFKKQIFIDEVVLEFSKLELKARISWIAKCLRKYLPNDFHEAVNILLSSLPAPNNPNLSDDDFGDFVYASYSCFVAEYGCVADYLEFSLSALYKITQFFSAEYAIRYFINAFPLQTLSQIEKWSKDSNYHVRRLCSEGTRPKLPWAQKININLDATIKILDNLYADNTRFVVRSVANHLNDIAKIDANLAINILKKWQKMPQQNIDEMNYLLRHSLRYLIKSGNVDAMIMLGFSENASIKIANFQMPISVKLNYYLEFSFELSSQEDAKISVDYVIYFANKYGKITRQKIYKLKNLYLAKDECFLVAKRHRLIEDMTTRKIYRGDHQIEIKINGKSVIKKNFLVA